MTKKRIGARFVLINAIRVILILALFLGFYNQRSLVVTMSLLGIIATFLPFFLKIFFRVDTPVVTEIIVIFFIYGILFLADVRGLFAEFWWWGALLNLTASFALGLVGLSAMYALYRGKMINASPFVISFFAFCFAVAIGALWELFEFVLDSGFGFVLQKSIQDTMGDMIFNSVGALIISVIGYNLLKKNKSPLFSGLVERYVRKNPEMFRADFKIGDHERHLKELIGKGEGRSLEFKSTLRKNLYTGIPDKRIEHSILKTVAAYLNSDGGILLVGVGNKGEVLGIEKDLFDTDDKANLHFTNLIKQHIGSEFLPYIKNDTLKVGDKSVLRVECDKSDRHVFLKRGDEEEFYVRNGPSSVKLEGSALIEYIKNNFGDV